MSASLLFHSQKPLRAAVQLLPPFDGPTTGRRVKRFASLSLSLRPIPKPSISPDPSILPSPPSADRSPQSAAFLGDLGGGERRASGASQAWVQWQRKIRVSESIKIPKKSGSERYGFRCSILLHCFVCSHRSCGPSVDDGMAADLGVELTFVGL